MIYEIMHRFFIVPRDKYRAGLLIYFMLFFFSVSGFAQQNIPLIADGRVYQIQVGAFKIPQNAEGTFGRLQAVLLNPSLETHMNFTRVLVKGIKARDVPLYIERVKSAGFFEILVREDAFSEKWEIASPFSAYSSFEFNQDNNYIVVENNAREDDEERIHFGEYTMPARDIINLKDFGTLQINRDTGNNIDFSFFPIEEPNRAINLTASKTERIPDSPDLELFCRTWKVVNCTNREAIGNLLIISKAGTYFFTAPDGEAYNLSQWRWYDNKTEQFDYTHNNWENYGRAAVLDLKVNYLKIFDPGFVSIIPGYSSAGANDYWELVPVR